jgi:sec-independent protein translocase protein TatC
MTGSEMTFLDHLTEARKRIIHAFWGFLVGFGIAYSYSTEIFEWLKGPLCQALQKDECSIVYLGLAEPFFIYLKVGIIGGVFISAPWIFYQVWKFMSPGLRVNEKKWVFPFVFVASVMFTGGSLFGYFIIFPLAFEFFLSVAPLTVMPMLSMSNYFSFASALLFAFGTLFETPVIVVLLNLAGIVKAETLWKTWRYVVVGLFALSAIMTPADPYTMVLMAIPLTLLYMISLIICSMLENMKKASA